MATLAAPQDSITKTVIPSFIDESTTNIKDIAGLEKPPTDHFGRFMPKENVVDAQLLPGDASILREGLPKDLLEQAFEQTSAPADIPTPETASTAIPTIIPAQKESAAVRETVAPTDLQSAESIVSAEVSTDVLSLAMAIQEDAGKAQVPMPTQLSKEPNGTHGDFPVLKEVVLSGAPTPMATPAKKEALPTVAAPVADTEITEGAELTAASLIKKPETTATTSTQAPKTRESVTNTTDVSLKETARAVEGAAMDREAESDLDREASLKELHTKDNKGADSKANTTGKSFADNLTSASAKSDAPTAGETTSSSSVQSTDGKAVEAAFNRAQETGVSTTKAAPQAQSAQHNLPPQASAQEQIAFSIKNNAAKGKSEINLQLRPDSLGRVNVKIDINKEGQTYVVVATERSETRDLLQQDASKLASLLEDSGMNIDDGDISYNLFKDQAQQDTDASEDNLFGEPQSTTAKNTTGAQVTGPMIPLEMSEVRIPQHGGTWAAVA